jgi:hypothetical protein
MSDRLKVSSLLARRLEEHQVSLPALLQRVGLPAGFFQQEKIYVTTAELFALWRANRDLDRPFITQNAESATSFPSSAIWRACPD